MHSRRWFRVTAGGVAGLLAGVTLAIPAGPVLAANPIITSIYTADPAPPPPSRTVPTIPGETR